MEQIITYSPNSDFLTVIYTKNMPKDHIPQMIQTYWIS